MGFPSKQTGLARRRGREALALACALGAALTCVASAVAAPPPGSAQRSAQAWERSTAAASKVRRGTTPLVAPRRYSAFALDAARLRGVLAAAPRERTHAARRTPLVVSVPTPDGDFARFAIAESPIMEPGLAAAHPEIRTYAGRGVDDPGSTMRLDLSPLGFHAAVRADDGSWFVEPRYRDQSQYVSYKRDALAADPYGPFVEPEGDRQITAMGGVPPPAAKPGGQVVQLRTYRLALVSDPTYATAVGGLTTAAKVTLMNRVNQLYETDFAIRMVLIDATDDLNLDTAALATEANGPCGASACFTAAQLSSCGDPTLGRMDVVPGLLAGARNFDVGHILLGMTGGGFATVGVVGGAGKAEGCTGSSTPIGDAFAVDYVAHELGHQFGADHTFNGTQGSCTQADRATGLTSVEPGSGTTVMAYAGICGTDDTQAHGDPYFSQASTTQVSAYVAGTEPDAGSVQQAALTGFDGTDSFQLTYGGQTSPTTITNGTNYTATAIKDAIQATPGWPAGATVTVDSVTDAGFVVTFGGTLAAAPAALLGLHSMTGANGFFGETVTGGPATRGGTATATVNHVPGVTTAAGFTIPVRTPFTLTASGSDIDNDPLTYLWEQNDPGLPTLVGGTALRSDAKTNGPLFRVFGVPATPGSPNAATATPSRSFPDLQQVLAGNTNAATGSCPWQPVDAAVVDCYSEFLPTAAWLGADLNRTLHFRVTARDNAPGAGGVSTADTQLTLAPAAGPFRISSAAAPQSVSSLRPFPVTWDVAQTNLPPVSAANVKISLSTDGGATFPHVLAASTPNDGSQDVDLPAIATTHGRIKIEAVDNVFFDASRADLSIDVGLGASPVDLGSVEQGKTGPTTVAAIVNGGPGAVKVDTVSVSGADGSAIAIVGDECSARTLAAQDTCSVALQLHPQRTGAHTAALLVPSDASGPPLTVALTGTGTAPPQPPPTTTLTEPPTTPTTPATPTTTINGPPTTPTGPTAEDLARALATRTLGVAAVPLGTLGTVRLYGRSTSRKLGKPLPSRRLAVAVCTGQPCVVVSTAQLRTTDRHGKATTRRITLGTLRMRTQTAAGLTLALTATQRRAIRGARTATVLVTVTVGTRSLSRRYSFTVG
ncbi:MAG: hypothetical protein JWO02_2914 [Solirubrobacterales bacterium]|nr:hypothetical protein [Solirubrobacterales bacterium]